MPKTLFKYLALIITFGLTGCATISGVGKDNTPAPSALTNYTAQVTPRLVWSANGGSGSGKNYLNFVPAVNGNGVFAADQSGHITAINAANGRLFWQQNLQEKLVTGPGVGNGVVVVGGDNADVFGLDQSTGKTLWHVALSDPITAIPVINDNTVILKTLDGELWALNANTGSVLWTYNHGAPLMVLAGGSRPVVVGNKVITGYADGKLGAYSLNQGKILWETQVAEPTGNSDVAQMIDIVADPQLIGSTIYVVTYQGNIDAIDTSDGNIIWQTPLSSYTGMTISNNIIYVTDTQGVVYAINRNTGQVIWQQNYLQNRMLTAPELAGNNLVIADGEGYLHWLSQSNGVTVGRTQVSTSPIIAKPIVDGNKVYILSTNGDLKLYQF